MSRRPGRWLAAAVWAAPVGVACAQVSLRGASQPLDATVDQVSEAGVRVRLGADSGDPGAVRVISWDQVRSVEGNKKKDADLFAEVADKAWRARTRLERYDMSAAEPLFEELSRRMAAQPSGAGPTGAVVAEGLLRCRLSRGAQGASVWPWLDWIGVLEPAGGTSGVSAQWIGGRINLPDLRDPATDLIPALPPMWLADGTLQVIAASDEWARFERSSGGGGTGGGGGGAASELGRLYRHAARFEAGMNDPAPTISSTHPGVRLVADIVAARSGTAEERKAARTALEQRLSGQSERWIEAWCRAGIGRSWLMESDPADRRRGVMELMHLPARFGEDHPYLAGLALAECAAALDEAGDSASARVLATELKQRFPGHPALEWKKLMGLGAPPVDAKESKRNGHGLGN